MSSASPNWRLPRKSRAHSETSDANPNLLLYRLSPCFWGADAYRIHLARCEFSVTEDHKHPQFTQCGRSRKNQIFSTVARSARCRQKAVVPQPSPENPFRIMRASGRSGKRAARPLRSLTFSNRYTSPMCKLAGNRSAASVPHLGLRCGTSPPRRLW